MKKKKSPNGSLRSVQPYVKALGIEGAVEFLLRFGGQMVWISDDPGRSVEIFEKVGAEAAGRLVAALGRGPVKPPIAKPWVARQLFAMGWSKSQIAQELHMTQESIRLYLRGLDTVMQAAPYTGQLDLFQ